MLRIIKFVAPVFLLVLEIVAILAFVTGSAALGVLLRHVTGG